MFLTVGKSGRTQRQRLAIVVMTDTRISVHCLTSHVGTGSGAHCLLATELTLHRQ